jgi:hypothetical protein
MSEGIDLFDFLGDKTRSETEDREALKWTCSECIYYNCGRCGPLKTQVLSRWNGCVCNTKKPAG